MWLQRPQGVWVLKTLVKELQLLQKLSHSGLQILHGVVWNDFSASARVENQ
jgi:hypothetical protein